VATGEFRAVDPAAVSRIIAASFVTHALWVSTVLPPTPAVGPLDQDAVFAQLESFVLAALRPDAGGDAGPDARPDAAPPGAPAGGPTPDAPGVPTT
jgi:hypothetical protein